MKRGRNERQVANYPKLSGLQYEIATYRELKMSSHQVPKFMNQVALIETSSISVRQFSDGASNSYIKLVLGDYPVIDQGQILIGRRETGWADVGHVGTGWQLVLIYEVNVCIKYG